MRGLQKEHFCCYKKTGFYFLLTEGTYKCFFCRILTKSIFFAGGQVFLDDLQSFLIIRCNRSVNVNSITNLVTYEVPSNSGRDSQAIAYVPAGGGTLISTRHGERIKSEAGRLSRCQPLADKEGFFLLR